MDPRPDAPRAEAAHARHVRWVFLALGWGFFALGVVGVVLPVVPTTPFMLLALWAFSRSSRRFHDWLYTHRVLGPPLQRWQRERAVPAWAKAVALVSMAASTGYVALVVRPPWYGLLATGTIVAAGLVYIVRLPTSQRRR